MHYNGQIWQSIVAPQHPLDQGCFYSSIIYVGNLFDIDVDIKSNNTIGLLLPHGEGMAACNDNKQNGLLRLS